MLRTALSLQGNYVLSYKLTGTTAFLTYDKFFFAQRNYTFAHKQHSLPTFSLFAQTPPFLPRLPHSVPSLLRSQGLGQLR